MVIKCGFNHSSYKDVSPVTHSLTCSLFYYLVCMYVCVYGLFNTRAFTVVSIIFMLTNPYCVTGFDIIQAFHHTYFYCSKHFIVVTNPYCVTGFDIIPALISRLYYSYDL
jgi:hypothetical protein